MIRPRPVEKQVQFQDCKFCFGPKYIFFRIASLAANNRNIPSDHTKQFLDITTDAPPPISPAVIIISFGTKTLRAWVKANPTQSNLIHWPDAPLTTQEAQDLPAVIAYESNYHTPVWGFSVPEDHPYRVANLHTLLEPNGVFDGLRTMARNQFDTVRKYPTQVISDFLRAVIEHIRWCSGLTEPGCKYMFLFPSLWRKREIGLYKDIIGKAGISAEKVALYRNNEIGALRIVENICSAPEECVSVILLLTNEGKIFRFN